jgi:hypothetical protein
MDIEICFKVSNFEENLQNTWMNHCEKLIRINNEVQILKKEKKPTI